MILYQPSFLSAGLRNTIESSVIETLLRKGWEETTAPSYNPETQQTPSWSLSEGKWQVVDKTDAQMLAERISTCQTETNELYKTLPLEVQATYAPLYTSVRGFLKRGEVAVAWTMVNETDVPVELQEVKAAILEHIPYTP